jgi:hypothetical protein
MSHHFDTPTAREDPRINLCDFYLFDGAPGTTAMAMTVNPDAGLSAPDSFREEGLYAFRFDLDGDAREDVTFKLRFGAAGHGAQDEHRHVQSYEVRRSVGASATRGLDGDVIATGQTGETIDAASGVRVFAGLAPDLFAGDGVALARFRTAAFQDNRFDPDAFLNRKNLFERRNVSAIVLEVPTSMIGSGRVRSWATVSLVGHAPEVQVSRWGLPLITHIFLPDDDMHEAYNRAPPVADLAQFASPIGKVAATLTGLAGSAAQPEGYAKRLIEKLCPTTLPYELGTAASFDFAGINGRALADDVMDVILTLATNTALGDGVRPDVRRIRPEFPYFGVPYSGDEQKGVAPARARPKAG